MTLINFVTRIHFAERVLEEALRSEMERLDRRRPLIIAEARHVEGAIGQSIYSSFAVRTKFTTYSDIRETATEEAADKIAQTYQEAGHDMLIAFGGNNAIDLAKMAR